MDLLGTGTVRGSFIPTPSDPPHRGPNLRSGRILWFTLGGMLVGYFLLHPFAMLAYTIRPHHEIQVPMDMPLWARELHLAFSLAMAPMGLAFILLGGVAGFSLGAWYLQKERLARESLESQRRLAALETLKDLMVTLAHYIRNANLIIGGFSSRLVKHTDDPEVQRDLKMIQQAAREIEAVIDSLQEVTEISTVPYAANGRARMIDLKKELAERLAASQVAEKTHES